MKTKIKAVKDFQAYIFIEFYENSWCLQVL
jgi:hypothetical protein